MKKLVLSILAVAVTAFASSQQNGFSFSSYNGRNYGQFSNQLLWLNESQSTDFTYVVNPFTYYRSTSPVRIRLIENPGVRVLRYGEWITVGGIIRR